MTQLGDRVFYWWETGAFGPTQVTGTVVKLNRVTITVQWDNRQAPQRVPRYLLSRSIYPVNWPEPS